MTVITGVIYPLLVTGIAQLMLPKLANGSLLYKEERTVGSILIAQNVTDERYFWPRPSAIDYNPLKPSGGSNLGPTSQKLKDIVAQRKQKLGDQAPAELLYASGSGLDPHISVETAYFQIPRIAKARAIPEDRVKALIDAHIEGKQFGFIGAHYVNVLILNHALEELK